MLSKTYKYELEVAPVKITWTQELVEDEDSGDFYVKLSPHVNFAMEYIHEGKQWGTGRKGSTPTKVDKIATPSATMKAAMRRNEIARQNRRIFSELKEEWTKDTQKKLRAEYNKRRGQRWNKKV